MNKTRKLRGGENTMSRRNRVRAMMMAPSSNMKSEMKNMGKGFMNSMKTMRNKAGQKLRNIGQTLKNKYNVMKTEAILENNFYNRPNVAGMEPGYASRNLLKVANRQQQKRREARERAARNRNTGMSSGNKYQAASMATSLFF